MANKINIMDNLTLSNNLLLAISIITSFFLMIYGCFAVFAPKKILNLSPHPSKNRFLFYLREKRKKRIEQPGYYLKLKLFGLLVILIAFLYLFVAIKMIMNR